MEEMAERLKALRKEKGWTQEELAGRLGVALRTQRAVGGREEPTLGDGPAVSPGSGGEGRQKGFS